MQIPAVRCIRRECQIGCPRSQIGRGVGRDDIANPLDVGCFGLNRIVVCGHYGVAWLVARARLRPSWAARRLRLLASLMTVADEVRDKSAAVELSIKVRPVSDGPEP